MLLLQRGMLLYSWKCLKEALRLQARQHMINIWCIRSGHVFPPRYHANRPQHARLLARSRGALIQSEPGRRERASTSTSGRGGQARGVLSLGRNAWEDIASVKAECKTYHTIERHDTTRRRLTAEQRLLTAHSQDMRDGGSKLWP